MGIEYISFSWMAVPERARHNFYRTIKDSTPPQMNKGLKPYHAKYEDGSIMFEDMKYYTLFLLKFQ